MIEANQSTITVTKAKDGRGAFFAVDRRAWHLVSSLGLNPAVAYLVMARGTVGDNRTTKWSTNAIEQRTNISRSRSQAAIQALETAGLVRRDPASKPKHPHYKLVPAHEVPGCEGYVAPLPDEEHGRVLAALGDTWASVPTWTGGAKSRAFQQWGSSAPHTVATKLVRLGRAEVEPGNRRFRAVLEALRCSTCRGKPAPVHLIAGRSRTFMGGAPPDWALELVPAPQ